EWVHVQLHQQKGMISLSPPTICNSALLNNPARTGGIRTPEACQRTKKQHLIQKTTSSSTFWCIWPPLFLIQNTPHRRGILLIHI
ncbi:hypothetical protein P2N76_23720, partial [Escherichia coli]